MSEFTFKDLTVEDVQRYFENANIFNLTQRDINKEQIMLASFSDEKLGSSVERLDVAVRHQGKWKVLNTDNIREYNVIPMEFVLNNVEYDMVLVVIRRMSNMLFDKTSANLTYYAYYKVEDKYRYIKDNKGLLGWLAKNRVCLDDSEETLSKLKDAKGVNLGLDLDNVNIVL